MFFSFALRLPYNTHIIPNISFGLLFLFDYFPGKTRLGSENNHDLIISLRSLMLLIDCRHIYRIIVLFLLHFLFYVPIRGRWMTEEDSAN